MTTTFSPGPDAAGSFPPREDDDVRTLAEELKEAVLAARARGLTQGEIAAEAEVSPHALSRALSGTRADGPQHVSEELLRAVCDAIGEEPVLVPSEIADEVRQRAQEARQARVERGAKGKPRKRNA